MTEADIVAQEIIATPNPGPQTWALSCPVFDLLYGGARGGGKSVFLVLDWLAHASRCGGKARGLLLRRTRPQLKDLLATMEKIMRPLGWVFAVSEWTWTGPDGSQLVMAYLERDADAENYHGWNLSWLGIDEAGNFPDSAPIDRLYATLRLPGVEHRLRMSANPGGPGHRWLKERYVDPARPFTPFTTKEGLERVYIPARLKDNPAVNTPEYRRQLAASGPAWLVKAWLDGDWNIVPGGGVIDPDLIRDVKPPANLERRIIGGDLAFTEDEWNDEGAFVELGKWVPGVDAPVQYHVLHVEHKHWTIPQALRRIFDLFKLRGVRWFRVEGGPSGKAIEPFVLERQRKEGALFYFQLTSHMRDKIAKNAAFAAAVGMGLVYADKSAPWWPEFRDECLTFDGQDGKQDNQVDAAGVAFREIDTIQANEPPPQAAPIPDPRSLVVHDQRLKAARRTPDNAGPRPMWHR